VAVGVRETVFRVAHWALATVDDRLFVDRPTDCPQPLLPLLGAGGLIVGVQQERAADRAAAVLAFE
jgi:hypothetical protein